MANRYATAVSMLCQENATKAIFGRVSFGAAGAPTLVTSIGTPASNPSKGILSVSRTSAGLYVFTFGVTQGAGPVVDKYIKSLGLSTVFNTAGTAAAPAAPICYIAANAVSTAGTMTIQFANLSGTATDPASGEILIVQFTFGDSST